MADASGAAEQLEIEGVINPARVLEALGAIGYTPESALCDIIDNSITHGQAARVWVELVGEPGVAENRRNNASRYIVADDGVGLDETGLRNALALGSDPGGNGGLGKFGLGLKSAGLSQGRRITVLSRVSGGEIGKRVLDVDHVAASGSYSHLAGDLTSEESEIWPRFLESAESGTIVIVDKTHKGNQPSIRATRQELERQLGVIYFYFLRGESPVDIRLNGEAVEPFDPLFAGEADSNGDLDEKRWDGKSTRWLSRQRELTIDPERNVKVHVEMTQLPHPPSFEDDQAATRQRYMISAGNYGFYVYRNKRLISWGERFTDIVPLDQDYYAFRGRILISETADEVLNIDVKKSRVLLSEDARSALTDHVYQPRIKSRDAWQHATETMRKKLGVNTQDQVNERLSASEEIDALPSEPDSPEVEERRRQRRQRQEQTRPVTPTEREQVVHGAQRVLFEDFLLDNVVWERGYDASIGTIVRLNQSHRFIRHVFQHYAEEFGVSLVLNSLFLCLARTESYAINNLDVSESELEEIFERLRRIFSEQVAKVTQEILEPGLTEETS